MKSSLILLLACTVCATLRADWRSDADARIDKIRKGNFAVEVLDAQGAPVRGATVSYHLLRHEFLFGTAIAYAPYTEKDALGTAYRKFILDNLNGLVCENEMKWYSDEVKEGHEDYSQADALVAFAQKHHLMMRGHCLFWEKQKFAMPWQLKLTPAQLRAAVERRLVDTVTRYKGKVISWDVDNEMLDGDFFRSRLGDDIVPWMFKTAHKIDPHALLFVNEYGILGNPEKTERYIAEIRKLQAEGAPVGGIGIQSHDTDRFTDNPNAKIINDGRPDWMLRTPLTPKAFLATLDRLYSATGLPIHITEISAKVHDPERRAKVLDMLFRLSFSHPGVQALVLWGFDAKHHWLGADAALMNADGTLTPAGVDITHLIHDVWTSNGTVSSNDDGRAAFRAFYGTYELTITLPGGGTVKRTVFLGKAVHGPVPVVVN
ncbi:endo-1,4-beta-xylanase Z precursor [mine drainage metagenome]|uniref:Endo-1,4-beta-xylanase Z n=1 Tax=mine drainage metagenome TaxID=410659 RepID=A0A1J5SY01_9ZZZZ